MSGSPSTYRRRLAGFTLIELIIVLSIIGIGLGIVGLRAGTFAFYREENFLRQLNEKLSFLHHQAVADQAFYRLEFDFNAESYRIGVMKPEADVDPRLEYLARTAGTLTLELAAFLSPSMGASQTMIPPPNFPSLAEPVSFPSGTVLLDVETREGQRSRAQGGTAGIIFSPRGFSEFAVLHFQLRNGQQRTVLVNPFTGIPETFPGYRDFEATFGKSSKAQS